MFSVSNDSIEGSPDFGPKSVTLTVKDLVPEKTIISKGFSLASCSLLLSQRQDFLKNHLARVRIIPSKEKITEMKEEVLSFVGALDMDTNGYQVSDLDDVDFFGETDCIYSK